MTDTGTQPGRQAGAPSEEPGARRLFVTDCEGPLTRNDNAQELAQRFLPHGAEFFARLSRYDDFLADVVRRPGYNAGDTLRLLPPFLLAYDVTDADVEQFSAENVLFTPGAAEALATIGRWLPTYIISTSYTPYIRALCRLTNFPPAHVRCTELRLGDWRLSAEEKSWLREQLERVVRRPILDIPADATAVTDLSPRDQETVADLDNLFWREMEGTVAGALLQAVRPVGGQAKLTALEEIVRTELGERRPPTQRPLDRVMYVGDSITDAPPLAAVRAAGGVALSFNGNAYALAAAEFAAASADALPILRLAEAFARGGRPAVLETVRAWPKATRAPAAGTAAIVGIIAEAREALAQASLEARRAVRGERLARLG